MDKGLVSVVIPCYRQSHYLPEAIASVLAQQYRPCEVVVVDDGSPDDTSAVAARYPGVRCFRQPNQGLSAARNAGFLATTGEFVVFLDADDRLLPGAIDTGVRVLRERPECALAVGLWRLISVEGDLLREVDDPGYPTAELYTALLRRNYIGCPAVVVYRRTVVDEVGVFDVSLPKCEDYEMYLRIARRHSIAFHRAPAADYRMHAASMLRDLKGMREGCLRVLEMQRPLTRDHPANEAARREGIRGAWNQYYPSELLERARALVRAGRWFRACLPLLVLLCRYPRRFTEDMGRKIRITISP